MEILYVTFDGILQPLGHSQVVRYLEGLSERGLNYTILSLEREENLADTQALNELEHRLAASGIEWVQVPYRQGLRRLGPVQNQVRAVRAAREIASSRNIGLVHARSYLGASVAWMLKKITDIPYLFDIRGYWIDERLDAGRWFTNPLVEKIARKFEQQLYSAASGVVTLTELSADDIQDECFGPWEAEKPIVTIPTCADYDSFRHDKSSENLPNPLLELQKGEDLVVGFVGSINPAYHVRESLELFYNLRELRDNVHLLALTQQQAKMNTLLAEMDIAKEETTVLSVPHDEMPQVLPLMDWGFLLLKENFPRRASMPTKLAEFFAAGVRPIHFGCNAEVEQWVQHAQTGLTLDGISRPDLKSAAMKIARGEIEDAKISRARRVTRSHFGIRTGIQRYESISKELLGLRPPQYDNHRETREEDVA